MNIRSLHSYLHADSSLFQISIEFLCLSITDQPFPIIQFETDVSASEQTCQTNGVGCVVPPVGAQFYPFYAVATDRERVPELDAGACFYGIPSLDVAELKKIKTPLICHFANKDDWCTPAKVNEVEVALKQSKSPFEFYRYDAQHAFMNEARPQVYDAVSAKAAWERTLEFLKKALA